MPKKNKPPQDEYSIYEKCLSLLGDLLDIDSINYEKFVVYWFRLTSNIDKARLYGDTPDRRADRNEILMRLNSLSKQEFGICFFYSQLKKPTHFNAT